MWVIKTTFQVILITLIYMPVSLQTRNEVVSAPGILLLPHSFLLSGNLRLISPAQFSSIQHLPPINLLYLAHFIFHIYHFFPNQFFFLSILSLSTFKFYCLPLQPLKYFLQFSLFLTSLPYPFILLCNFLTLSLHLLPYLPRPALSSPSLYLLYLSLLCLPLFFFTSFFLSIFPPTVAPLTLAPPTLSSPTLAPPILYIAQFLIL